MSPESDCFGFGAKPCSVEVPGPVDGPSNGATTQARKTLTTALQEAGARKRVPAKAARTASDPVREALRTVIASLEDSKAENVVTIDIRGKSALGDYMIVASGRSHRHVGAIADHLLRDAKDKGIGPARVEGLPHCDWVLLDLGDIIVHIFRPEVRDFYGIEKMWQVPDPQETH
jgi:ribosome-associated protein